MTRSEVETLDARVLGEVRAAGADADFVATLIDQFIEEADLLTMTLRTAADHKNVQQMRAAAHRLKGCAESVGANKLGTLCGRLDESLKREAECAVDGNTVAAVDAELAHVRTALVLERARAIDSTPTGS